MLLFVITTVLMFAYADALDCYQCTNANSIANCRDVISCKPKEKCFKQSSGAGDQTSYTLGCKHADVFQHRVNGSVDFYRTWNEYENGFGDVHGEFWLGLRYMQQMTSTHNTTLRLDLEAADESTAYETYQNFYLSGPTYILHLGQEEGNAGDFNGLSYHSGHRFLTHDLSAANCAIIEHGAWWYHTCLTVNLNGEYVTRGTVSNYGGGYGGVIYHNFKQTQSLKSTKMMFRRV